jgi:hypothetical protein
MAKIGILQLLKKKSKLLKIENLLGIPTFCFALCALKKRSMSRQSGTIHNPIALPSH